MKAFFKFLLEWFTNLFAIRETRVSTIIVFSLPFYIIAYTKFQQCGTISENLRIVVLNTLYIIAGTSGLETIASSINQHLDNKKGEE